MIEIFNLLKIAHTSGDANGILLWIVSRTGWNKNITEPMFESLSVEAGLTDDAIIWNWSH